MPFLKGCLGNNGIHNSVGVLTNPELFAEAEKQIPKFHRICAKAMANDMDRWDSPADCELRHADAVKNDPPDPQRTGTDIGEPRHR